MNQGTRGGDSSIIGARKETNMKNVDMKVDGDKLTITVDLSKEFGPSSSGKTIIIASSEGNQTIEYKDGSYKIGLNVYRKP
jgi:hypothetical protein